MRSMVSSRRLHVDPLSHSLLSKERAKAGEAQRDSSQTALQVEVATLGREICPCRKNVIANKKCPPAGTGARGLALLGLRNAEPLHLPLERGTLHSETSCSAVGTANDPVSLA